MKDGNGTRAAIAAGYSPKQASSLAKKFIRTDKAPLIQEAIKEIRTKAIDGGVYNLKSAMAECDEGIAFAKETGNANAYAKLLELRSKLNGLLVEKHDVRMSGFTLNIGGMDEKPVIDVGSSIIPALSQDADPFS